MSIKLKILLSSVFSLKSNGFIVVHSVCMYAYCVQTNNIYDFKLKSKLENNDFNCLNAVCVCTRVYVYTMYNRMYYYSGVLLCQLNVLLCLC